MVNKAQVISEALAALKENDLEQAGSIIRSRYPFVKRPSTPRSWSNQRAMQVFWRDGFVDRYSGSCLVFPGALSILSHLLPDDFPEHEHWKMDQTHPAFWELFPTVDHIVPIARGGSDELDNLATTSMLRNQAKSSWSLEEIGWTLHEPGNLSDWDGLTKLSLKVAKSNPGLMGRSYFKNWHDAAIGLIDENGQAQE